MTTIWNSNSRNGDRYCVAHARANAHTQPKCQPALTFVRKFARQITGECDGQTGARIAAQSDGHTKMFTIAQHTTLSRGFLVPYRRTQIFKYTFLMSCQIEIYNANFIAYMNDECQRGTAAVQNNKCVCCTRGCMQWQMKNRMCKSFKLIFFFF